MPQLPKKREWTEEDREKFVELALGIDSPLKYMGELIEANNLALKSFMNPVLNESIRRMAVDFESPLRQLGQSIGKMMSDLAIEQLRESFKNLPTFSYPFDVIDGEYEYADDDSSNEPLKETALVPQESYVPVPITPSFPHSKSNRGIKRISGGNFAYKRKTLKGLSLNNREGQLLNIMHLDVDFYIDDVVMDENLYTHDTLGRSTFIKLLKKKFKKNGLIADIKRQGSGYILIDIKTRYTN